MKRPNPLKKQEMKRRLNVQLAVAVLISMSGVALIFMSFWVEPRGVIDSSVLVAFGELSTFAGALFGIDYTYKFKARRLLNNKESDQ